MKGSGIWQAWDNNRLCGANAIPAKGCDATVLQDMVPEYAETRAWPEPRERVVYPKQMSIHASYSHRISENCITAEELGTGFGQICGLADG
jgi:hypothetical protein